MSKTTHAQRLAQLWWFQVLGEVKPKFVDPEGFYLMEQFKKVKFNKQGQIKKNKFGNLVLNEFPSLIKMWEEKKNGSV